MFINRARELMLKWKLIWELLSLSSISFYCIQQLLEMSLPLNDGWLLTSVRCLTYLLKPENHMEITTSIGWPLGYSLNSWHWENLHKELFSVGTQSKDVIQNNAKQKSSTKNTKPLCQGQLPKEQVCSECKTDRWLYYKNTGANPVCRS